MPKIVINTCYGGFGLSPEALAEYNRRTRVWAPVEYDCFIERDDPFLVEVVEAMGSDANDRHSELKIVEVPDGVKWTIEEYDGKEWIAEVHRTWS
jgi:hypothetical protein